MGEVSFVCAPESVTIKDDSVTLRVPKTYIESLYVTSLENLKIGDAIRFGGTSWSVYGFENDEDDNDEGIIKLISVSCATYMEFGDCNDWEGSAIRNYLYVNILPRILGSIVDEKDMVPINLDLAALDGSGEKNWKDDIAILSFNEYRNNNNSFETDWVFGEDKSWTLTPWTCRNFCDDEMCYITDRGVIEKVNVDKKLAVYPIVWLKRNAKIRQPTNYVKVDMSW